MLVLYSDFLNTPIFLIGFGGDLAPPSWKSTRRLRAKAAQNHENRPTLFDDEIGIIKESGEVLLYEFGNIHVRATPTRLNIASPKQENAKK